MVSKNNNNEVFYDTLRKKLVRVEIKEEQVEVFNYNNGELFETYSLEEWKDVDKILPVPNAAQRDPVEYRKKGIREHLKDNFFGPGFVYAVEETKIEEE